MVDSQWYSWRYPNQREWKRQNKMFSILVMVPMKLRRKAVKGGKIFRFYRSPKTWKSVFFTSGTMLTLDSQESNIFHYVVFIPFLLLVHFMSEISWTTIQYKDTGSKNDEYTCIWQLIISITANSNPCNSKSGPTTMKPFENQQLMIRRWKFTYFVISICRTNSLNVVFQWRCLLVKRWTRQSTELAPWHAATVAAISS